jgi:phosphopantothenoylcysteine decarboxylase / phosphopantothenate---cysteine ligase
MSNVTSFTGMKVMITAGPTREAIDPVRYISNLSTGKMGYAIAQEFCDSGADVTLISGPVGITPGDDRIRMVQVTTAAEMYEACCVHFPESNITVLSAAVADYTPKFASSQKIKKKEDEFTIELVKTVDIAAELGKRKRPGQMTIGFALETENELENARKKLRSKNLDMIVLNSLLNPGAGFGHETNQITILNQDGTEKSFELKSKKEVANDMIHHIRTAAFDHFEQGTICSKS